MFTYLHVRLWRLATFNGIQQVNLAPFFGESTTSLPNTPIDLQRSGDHCPSHSKVTSFHSLYSYSFYWLSPVLFCICCSLAGWELIWVVPWSTYGKAKCNEQDKGAPGVTTARAMRDFYCLPLEFKYGDDLGGVKRIRSFAVTILNFRGTTYYRNWPQLLYLLCLCTCVDLFASYLPTEVQIAR